MLPIQFFLQEFLLFLQCCHVCIFIKKTELRECWGGLIPEKLGRKRTPGTVLLLLLLGAACSVFANILVAMLLDTSDVSGVSGKYGTDHERKKLFLC